MTKGRLLFLISATLTAILAVLYTLDIVSISFVWIFSPMLVPIGIIMLICMLFGGLLVLPFIWDFVFKSK